jgi:hypothetical protein
MQPHEPERPFGIGLAPAQLRDVERRRKPSRSATPRVGIVHEPRDRGVHTRMIDVVPYARVDQELVLKRLASFRRDPVAWINPP